MHRGRSPEPPAIRVRALEAAPVRADGDYVLYWMTTARRPGWSHALDRAVAWARELGKPIVVLEALRVGYPWASDRLHRFVLEGMADNARCFSARPVLYYPYVEPRAGAGKGLLAALAARAAVIVTDDFPTFFVPRMLAAAARRLSTRLEAVDGNGLLPMRAASRVYDTAYAFRRFLQATLPAHLGVQPSPDPLARAKLPRMAGLPVEVARRWPPATADTLGAGAHVLARLPIDHGVPPVTTRGGVSAGRDALLRFVRQRLAMYSNARNEPEQAGTSELSPYLHFGHVGVHEVLAAVARREGWSPDQVGRRARGQRSGWWGMGLPAEAFLDQLVTWRELGYNMCWQRSDHDRYDSLPAWARRTLDKHASDPRPSVYTPSELEAGRTHDPLWNAAQAQLVREGRLHNYLRMLWGKKILEWSVTPQDALRTMIDLNNKHGLDGRDPNSYSGIFWVLGRYDRPWGPERPIFGVVRYMSSTNTARKIRVRDYIRRYAPA